MSSRATQCDTPADQELRKILASKTPTSFVMVAGAGSGKTTSLIKALTHLKSSHGSRLRAEGRQIACITYTEVAAGEIFEDIGRDDVVTVSTIHAFLWRIARPFQNDIREWVRGRIAAKITDLEAHNAKDRTREATRLKNNALIEGHRSDLQELDAVRTFNYGTGSRYADGILGHSDIIVMVPELLEQHSTLRAVVAQRFPFVLVDESQDTFPQVVGALKAIERDAGNDIRLGFFGDPMQQIYATGIGPVDLEPGWREVEKPLNFRCPPRVLDVINAVRLQVPGSLKQEPPHRPEDASEPFPGSAFCFVLPIDHQRDVHLDKVRRWLADELDDPMWTDDSERSGVRQLVIEHRLAASRCGFEELFAALRLGSETVNQGAADGTAWPIRPFVQYITPLIRAVTLGHGPEQVRLLKNNSSAIAELAASSDAAADLRQLKTDVEQLAACITDGQSTIGDVLERAVGAGIFTVDDRFREFLSEDSEAASPPRSADATMFAALLDVPAKELIAYQAYLEDHSVFETHQGVKGTEQARVVVLLEDHDSNHNQFSYEKLFGLKDLSKKDIENQAAGKDDVTARTRRLFYVCCSRATRSLAVALYVEDVDRAAAAMRSSTIFPPLSVLTLDEL